MADIFFPEFQERNFCLPIKSGPPFPHEAAGIIAWPPLLGYCMGIWMGIV